MEEKILKESEASYFKSATNVLNGFLVLTNKRLIYSGTRQRVRLNHGAAGNILRDKMEKAMGYDNPQEEHIFDIPVAEVKHGFKRFGLSKRLVLTDSNGNEYKLMLKKSERNEWPDAIEQARNQTT